MPRLPLNKKMALRIDSEIEAGLRLRAKQQRCRPSKIARNLLWVGLEDFQPIQADSNAIKSLNDLSAELRRIGVNLNQVAFHLNASEKLDSQILLQSIEDFRPCLNETIRQVKHLQQALLPRR